MPVRGASRPQTAAPKMTGRKRGETLSQAPGAVDSLLNPNRNIDFGAAIEEMVKEVMVLADTVSKNERLSATELRESLKETRYEEFGLWMTEAGLVRMRKYDLDHDGSMTRDELRGAVGEYLFGDECALGNENHHSNESPDSHIVIYDSQHPSSCSCPRETAYECHSSTS